MSARSLPKLGGFILLLASVILPNWLVTAANANKSPKIAYSAWGEGKENLIQNLYRKMHHHQKLTSSLNW